MIRMSAPNVKKAPEKETVFCVLRKTICQVQNLTMSSLGIRGPWGTLEGCDKKEDVIVI